MSKEINRSSYSTYCEVKMLSEYNFDSAFSSSLQYNGDLYRLVREPDNAYDVSAVCVYIKNFKIGYLDRNSAAEVSGYLAIGDVYSVEHKYSKRADNYEPGFDNKYGDGYYRMLRIIIFNESKIAVAKGEPIPEKYLQKVNYADAESRGGYGCVVLLLIVFAVIIAIAAMF